MTDRVNGGVYRGQWTEGELRFFKVAEATILLADEGVPNADVEVIMEVIQTKATPVVVNFVDGEMYLALAYATGWVDAADMKAAIDAEGYTATVTEVDFVLA